MKFNVTFELELEADNAEEAIMSAVEISEDPRLWVAKDKATGDVYALVGREEALQ